MSNLDPAVADLLAAIRDLFPPGADIDYREAGMVAHGALNAVLATGSPEPATRVIRRYQAYPTAFWRTASKPGANVCDTCHSEPVVVIDGTRRQCSTCALKVCDCCQVRRATVIDGVTDLCPLCFEERAAEANRSVRLLRTPIEHLTVDDEEVTYAP